MKLSLWIGLHINFDKIWERFCKIGCPLGFPQKLRGGLSEYYFCKVREGLCKLTWVRAELHINFNNVQVVPPGKGPIRRLERGEWMGANKNSSPKRELGLCPKFITKDSHKSLSRSRSHNRPTNPRNKLKLKATRKCNSRSKGLRQFVVPGVDGSRWPGGPSARARRTVRKVTADGSKMRPEQQDCTTKNWQSVANPQTVWPVQTVQRPRADSPANLLQPKTPNSTDRNKAT
jgi:hypothetical protein